jgi:hypothetical protein
MIGTSIIRASCRGDIARMSIMTHECMSPWRGASRVNRLGYSVCYPYAANSGKHILLSAPNTVIAIIDFLESTNSKDPIIKNGVGPG